MDPLTLGLIFGGGGLLKSLTLDKAKENRERKLAAETQRYSPWTGLQAGPVKEADPLGSAMQFGATGAAMGQGMQNQAANAKLVSAQTNLANSMAGGVPTSVGKASALSFEPAATDFGSQNFQLGSQFKPKAWSIGGGY